MPWWEALQLTLGLLIPPLIAIHVIGTRLTQSLLGFDVDYPRIRYVQWSNTRSLVQQPVLVLVVWAHVVVGLHFLLRLKSWYPRALLLLYALVVLLPVLALLGFARAGNEAPVSGRENPVVVYAMPDPSTITGSMAEPMAGLIAVDTRRDGISDEPIV
jgi:adenylate cyclase